MTREDCIKIIFAEFKKNGIKTYELADKVCSVKVGRKLFMFSFYGLSFTISAYWSTQMFSDHKLMSMDFFYEDVTMIWVNEKKLFVLCGKSGNVVNLGKD